LWRSRGTHGCRLRISRTRLSLPDSRPSPSRFAQRGPHIPEAFASLTNRPDRDPPPASWGWPAEEPTHACADRDGAVRAHSPGHSELLTAPETGPDCREGSAHPRPRVGHAPGPQTNTTGRPSVAGRQLPRGERRRRTRHSSDTTLDSVACAARAAKPPLPPAAPSPPAGERWPRMRASRRARGIVGRFGDRPTVSAATAPSGRPSAHLPV
jgi:hypothetical protein